MCRFTTAPHHGIRPSDARVPPMALSPVSVSITASPLFNGGAVAKRCFGTWKRSSDDAYYVSQNYDESRWALAAAAAKRVMEMTNGRKLPCTVLYG